jgi:hypothetical protein
MRFLDRFSVYIQRFLVLHLLYRAHHRLHLWLQYMVVDLFWSYSGFSAEADNKGERIGPAYSLSCRCIYVRHETQSFNTLRDLMFAMSAISTQNTKDRVG